MPTALITGITGQDGAYLARRLLQDGYRVVGMARRSASGHAWRLDELGIRDQVELINGELLEQSNLLRVLKHTRPDEIYNLAALSFVGSSFEQPTFTLDANTVGVARLLEAFREQCPRARFYQASTSEMYGNPSTCPQNEETPHNPQSPYAIAKLAAHHLVRNYREAYGLHCVSGILFNHESPLRGREFVTRTITHGLAEIACGRRETVLLGNLAACRDWGFAGDYVDGMVRMLRADEPRDCVLATGEAHSVEDFAETAARAVGLELEWSGVGEGRRAVCRDSGRTIFQVDPQRYRPTDVNALRGDPALAREHLGWSHRVSLPELVEMMVNRDLQRMDGA